MPSDSTRSAKGRRRVPREHPTTNNQVAPAVAMNSFGDFVIVWATKGQSFSYFNDIHGQMYDRFGNTVGGEFRVNSADIPGISDTPSSNELHPSVAMSDSGCSSWLGTHPPTEKSGVILDSVIMARLFDATGNPIAVAPPARAATTSSSRWTSATTTLRPTRSTPRSWPPRAAPATTHGPQCPGVDGFAGQFHRGVGGLPGQRRWPDIPTFGQLRHLLSPLRRPTARRKQQWINRPT